MRVQNIVDEEQRSVYLYTRRYAHSDCGRFASTKRESIQACQEFKEISGELYLTISVEKDALAEATKPVYDWFKSNVCEGDHFSEAFQTASLEAEVKFAEEFERDLK